MTDMRLIRSAALIALSWAFFLGYVPFVLAQAAPDTTVHIGFGDIIGQIGIEVVPWAASALVLAITGLVLKFFPAAGALLTTQRTAQVEQLLERALGYAASQLQANLKGRELDVNVKNELIANAVQYAIDHGSKALIDFMGGQSVLADKVEARVLTSPAVQAAQAPLATATVASSAISQQPTK
jgi:hypothetical protein